MTKKIIIVVLAMILCIGLVACNKNKKNNDGQYTLTFYAEDGKTVVTTMEVSNKRISVPDAPKVEGYTFVGWYLDKPDSSLKLDGEFFMRNSASQDRAAYPKYSKNYLNLNYYVDGYRVSTLKIADEVIQLPEAPSKDHYIFEGWYLTSADSGVELTPDYFVSHPAEGDVDAHAKFTRMEYDLIFTFEGKPYECGFYTYYVYEYVYEYEYELDEKGNPKLDANGQLILVRDENGNPIIAKDENGEPILAKNKNGQPILVRDENGNPVPVRDENGDFIIARDENGNRIIARDENGDPILEYKSTIKISDKEIDMPVVVPAPKYNSVFIGWYIENYKNSIGSNYFVDNPATENVTLNAEYTSAFTIVPTGIDTCTITGYIGKDKDIFVPDKIQMTVGEKVQSYTVTAIGNNAFKDIDFIESITIGNNIVSIGHNAFAGCKNLKTVEITAKLTDKCEGIFAGVKTITDITAPVWMVEQVENKAALVNVTLTEGEKINAEMFKGATKLESVVFPAELKTIGANAFAGCTSLKSINIPASVTEIALDAFVYCPSVKAITVAAENKVYTSGDNNCIVKTEEKNNILIVGCANTVIYEGINEIAKYAFVGCTGLEDLKIPASVNKIAEDAFIGCDSIKSITAFKTEYYEAIGNCLIALVKDAEGKPNNRLILGCKNSVIARNPDNTITSISKYAFSSCKGLKEICIPAGVTSLEAGSFDGCTLLESIVIVNKDLVYDETIFAACKAVKNIEVPEQWLNYFVENHAKNLENIVLTSGTEIADKYFSKCTALTTVTLPDTLTTIGVEAFVGCNNLKYVIITENSKLESIGRSAFENCSKFVAIAYAGEENVFVVPATVAYVGDKAFNNTAVKTLKFAEGCKLAVGYNVFANCYSLMSVTLSSTLSSVNFDAFEDSDNIKTVSSPAKFIRAFSYSVDAVTDLTITEGIVDSSENCYYVREMTNLKNLTIGAGVTAIDNKAFEGCSDLVSIVVDDGNAKYRSEGNCLITNIKGTDYLVLGCTTSEIPVGVSEIQSYAFAKSNIKEIVIPKNVARIEAYAFSACQALTNITIENPDIDILDKAFDGCKFVNTITVPACAIKYIPQAKLCDVTITSGTIAKGAFKDCLTLNTLNIYPDVTVSDGAFEGCVNINTLTAPASAISKAKLPVANIVTLTINKVNVDITKAIMADEYKNLKYLTIVSDLADARDKIDDDAFGTTITDANIPAWAKCKMPASLIKLTISSGKVEAEAENLVKFPELTTLIIADDVTGIGDYAFANYTTLESVTIDGELATDGIGKYAFFRCTALTDINAPKFTVIGEGAFSECTALETVNLPSVTTIGAKAFYGCVKLANVSAPVATEIGDSAFEGCISIVSIELPKALKLGADAFAECLKLESIELPEAIEIGARVFDGCVVLSAIELPKAEKLGEYVFSNCLSLATVYIPVVTEIDEFVFDRCNNIVDVTVPAWAIDKMPTTITKLTVSSGEVEAVAVQFEKLETLVFSDGVTKIGDNAFYGYKSLKSVTVSATVTVIGDYAFSGCVELTALELPSVEKIGVGAFSGCVALTKIVAPKVTEIGAGAFDGCDKFVTATVHAAAVKYMPATIVTLTISAGKVETTEDALFNLPNLKTVVLADGVTEIGNYAFANCKALENIDLSKVEKIGNNAFAGCAALAEVYLTSLETIGNSAFANCTALEFVQLSEKLTVIAEYAFSGCVSLKTIDLSLVEKIGDNAFEGCKLLTTLDLTNLKEIGTNVFYKDATDPITIEEAIIPSLAIVRNEIPFSVKKLVILGGEITSKSLQAYTYQLESLTIGADVTYIAADAINQSTVIENVTVDENNARYEFKDNKLVDKTLAEDADGYVVWDFNA